MQKYYDYHTHSAISFDAQVSIDASCRLADERGAAGLTFTEHLELYSKPGSDNYPDLPRYRDELLAAREKWPLLELGLGMEVDLNPDRREDIEAFLRQAEWDFLLGSVHDIDGLTTYNGAFSAGKSKEETYGAYFAGLYRHVKQMDCFDVLGHLDVIRRDARYGEAAMAYEDYAGLIDPVLRLLIERGQGLEVNTAGWRYLLNEAHPGLQVLRRYRQLGGEIITCGSDAHSARHICYRIKEGYQLIKEAGFKYITLFSGRKPKQLKLEI